MNYQNILCAGDSLTFGARTYGCYPLYLSMSLSNRTPYEWRAINRSQNGLTARDLWFKMNYEIDIIKDTYLACLLIGTNDVANNCDLKLFEEYYRQILRAFFIKNYKTVLCGEILPIFPDGHVFFNRNTIEMRKLFNNVIHEVVDEFPKCRFVKFTGIDRSYYEDPVHLTEKANEKVAESFCEAILSL